LFSKNSALLFQVAGVSARNSFTHGLKHAELVGAAERNDWAEARRTKSARTQKLNPAKRGARHISLSVPMSADAPD
jgi:hypothetical protein